MARSKYGHSAGFLFHTGECGLSGDMDAGSCWAGGFYSSIPWRYLGVEERKLRWCLVRWLF